MIRPCEGRITSPYGMRTHQGVTSLHQGVDLAQSGTVPVYAAKDGVVSRASKDGVLGTYGNVVMIKHGTEMETVYAHLRSFSVSVGQKVSRGQQIGIMGNTDGGTGRSTGQHLHFEVNIPVWNQKRNAVDPMMYLPLEVALKYGDKGPNVKTMQEKLVQIGYLKTADGSFGPTTESAVKSFQIAYKLDADGQYGPLTQKELDRVLAPKPKPITPKNEVDEMAQLLPETQKTDMKKLLTNAYTKDKEGNIITKDNESDRIFSVDHTSKVDTMTRGQATDFLISYIARTS